MDRIPRFTHTSEPTITGDLWGQPQIYHEYRGVVIEEDILCLVTFRRDESKEGNHMTISAGTTIPFLMITSIIELDPTLAQTELTFEVKGTMPGDIYFTVISYPGLTKACDF